MRGGFGGGIGLGRGVGVWGGGGDSGGGPGCVAPWLARGPPKACFAASIV